MMTKSTFSAWQIALTIVCLLETVIGSTSRAADRPNVMWILSEDSSKHYFRHFDPDGTPTPQIESLAANGVTFDHAFSNAPVCSVARTTLLIGCYGPRIGTQFHRAIQNANVPAGLTLFPARLKAAGYYTTNNSKQDYNVVLPKQVWDKSSDKATWRNRPTDDTPFFHVQTIKVSHESSLHFPKSSFEASKLDVSNVQVPAFLPDTPLTLYTKSYYHTRIQEVDKQVGALIDQLREDGLLESTFVFYFGDHGGVLPRSKGYLFETGLHVPLVVRVPEKFKRLCPFEVGSRTEGFVEFVDFPATTLALAGIDPSPAADGKAFLGTGITDTEVNARNETFGYADRFDEKYETVRSLRIGKYKYIWSTEPFTPDGLFNEYRFKMLAYQQWRDAFVKGELNPIQSSFFLPKPAERLYDLEADPDETNNLSGNPEFAGPLKMLRERLTARLKGMPDLSLFPEAVLIEEALGAPVAFGQANKELIGRLIDVANLAFADGDAQPQLISALKSENAWERYRAAMVSAGLKDFGSELKEALTIALDDPEPLCSVRAAQALAIVNSFDPRPTILKSIGRADADAEVLEILNVVVQLNDRPQTAYRFDGKELDAAIKIKRKDGVNRRLAYLAAGNAE